MDTASPSPAHPPAGQGSPRPCPGPYFLQAPQTRGGRSLVPEQRVVGSGSGQREGPSLRRRWGGCRGGIGREMMSAAQACEFETVWTTRYRRP